MMPRRLILLLLTAIVGCRAFASPEPPLQPGEKLKYSVTWAIVPGAGEIVVSAEEAGPAHLKITTHTSTRRLARVLLPFDAVAEARYEVKSGRVLSIHDRSTTRSKYAEHLVTFDHSLRKASYTEIGATRPRFLEMPAGDPSDLISALLETRCWSLKPGEKRDALVIFGDDFYELTIHALRYENVVTSLGRFRTLVLQPRMDKTPPKGMFKRGSTVQVWIAQDERRLPVKFEVMFNIGTGTALLESYTPPTANATLPPAEKKGPASTAATQ